MRTRQASAGLLVPHLPPAESQAPPRPRLPKCVEGRPWNCNTSEELTRHRACGGGQVRSIHSVFRQRGCSCVVVRETCTACAMPSHPARVDRTYWKGFVAVSNLLAQFQNTGKQQRAKTCQQNTREKKENDRRRTDAAIRTQLSKTAFTYSTSISSSV